MWRDTANYPTRRDQGYPGGEEGCKSDIKDQQLTRLIIKGAKILLFKKCF